jgi:hypothetical protein
LPWFALIKRSSGGLSSFFTLISLHMRTKHLRSHVQASLLTITPRRMADQPSQKLKIGAAVLGGQLASPHVFCSSSSPTCMSQTPISFASTAPLCLSILNEPRRPPLPSPSLHPLFCRVSAARIHHVSLSSDLRSSCLLSSLLVSFARPRSLIRTTQASP